MDTETARRQQKIIHGLANNDAMLLADLIRASGLSRVQFTPALRQLLNQKKLSVKVLSPQGSSVSQRIDGHIGKKLFIMPFNGVQNSVTEAEIATDVEDSSAELLSLRQQNTVLQQRVKELEQRCQDLGRVYSESQLRQIIDHLQR